MKKVNIVTNHINKFKKIEEYLYNEFGIILNISNNKSKSLLKSEIIINFDFPEELINQYRIYESSILININDRIDIKSKRFNGININYYKIEIEDKYKLNGFQDEIIYESLIYNINSFREINRKITKDRIIFYDFIGNNGKISLKTIDKNIIKR